MTGAAILSVSETHRLDALEGVIERGVTATMDARLPIAALRSVCAELSAQADELDRAMLAGAEPAKLLVWAGQLSGLRGALVVIAEKTGVVA